MIIISAFLLNNILIIDILYILESFHTSNRLIEPELMCILMKNAQVEYRLAQISKNSPLVKSKLLLIKKKAYRSLSFTESFETDELIAYLDLVNHIDENTYFTGIEPYPG